MLVSQAIIARRPEIPAPESTSIASAKSSGPAIAIPIAAKTTARIRLTAGPATAILNSVPGESLSRDIRATPPKSHRVISVIGIPRRLATAAWPSSCRRIEPKNASAEITASRYGS